MKEKRFKIALLNLKGFAFSFRSRKKVKFITAPGPPPPSSIFLQIIATWIVFLLIYFFLLMALSRKTKNDGRRDEKIVHNGKKILRSSQKREKGRALRKRRKKLMAGNARVEEKWWVGGFQMEWRTIVWWKENRPAGGCLETPRRKKCTKQNVGGQRGEEASTRSLTLFQFIFL